MFQVLDRSSDKYSPAEIASYGPISRILTEIQGVQGARALIGELAKDHDVRVYRAYAPNVMMVLRHEKAVWRVQSPAEMAIFGCAEVCHRCR
jgi:hypothetical protein